MKRLATLLLTLLCLQTAAQETDSLFLYYVDGRAVVQRDSLYGFVDRSGREVIPCRYQRAYCFNDGIAIIRHNHATFAIDTMGNRLDKRIEIPRFQSRWPFEQFVGWVQRRIPFVSSDECEQLKGTQVNAVITIGADGRLTACERADDSSERAADRSERAADSPKRADDSSEWADDSSEQAADSPKRADDSSKRADDSSKRAADSSKRAADSPKPATDSPKQAADSSERAADSSEQAADSSKRATDSPKQAADSSEWAADSSERAADSPKPAADSSERAFEKVRSVVMDSPAWTPGTIDGEPVEIRYLLSVDFRKIKPLKCYPMDVSQESAQKKLIYPLFQGKYAYSFYDWFRKHQFIKKAADYQRATSGVVRAAFTIDTKGRLGDIEIFDYNDDVCRDKTIDILKKSPRWTPAILDGVPVAGRYQWLFWFHIR